MAQDFGELLLISFKFGGYWVNVHNKERRKYKSGNQKTMKYTKSSISFVMLQTEVEKICPLVRGHTFEIHYHISGSSPKEYAQIVSDIEVGEMLNPPSGQCSYAEIVVSTINVMNPSILPEVGVDLGNSRMRSVEEAINDDFSDSIPNEDEVDSQLCIGARFDDAHQFKQFLRTRAITDDFDVVISSSDKKRIIAVCPSPGCLWRVRASVCADGETFEIRRVCGTHSCPGVNRTVNKKASVDWVATEVLDIVKRYPEDQHVNSFLGDQGANFSEESDYGQAFSPENSSIPDD